MNVNLLIDAIVRQTVVLIAQLATAAGTRAPLAHIANEVFLNLVAELKEQGLGQKVIADMFGLALRTYHNKIKRLAESRTERGVSLWEAVLTFIAQRRVVLRADILRHFLRDDEQTLRGVLNDLVASSLIFRTGRGDSTAYRAADPDELPVALHDTSESVALMLQVAIHRLQPARLDDLAKLLPLSDDALQQALNHLLLTAAIQAEDTPEGVTYSCNSCVISYEATIGWEAAVFDHYQALVSALCTKLAKGQPRALPNDAVGGSTWGFDLWPGHPLEAEALALLRTVRAQASDLRSRIDASNAAEAARLREPPEITRRVTFYAGQTVLDDLNTDGDPT